MDISVLLPTRNRPELLQLSTHSLLILAERPDDIEFLVAVDEDAQLRVWPAGNVHVMVSAERFGSARMHEYYNGLARLATGTWLMIWNDDATMHTLHWDAIVRSHPGQCLWLDHGGTGPEHCNMFPVWPRAWTEVTGYVADGSPRVDTWVQEVAEMLGKQMRIPVQVRHVSPDDQTWREGREYFLPEFHALRHKRIAEAARLADHGF